MSATDAFIFTSVQLWSVVAAAFAFGFSCGSWMEFQMHRFLGHNEESENE